MKQPKNSDSSEKKKKLLEYTFYILFVVFTPLFALFFRNTISRNSGGRFGSMVSSWSKQSPTAVMTSVSPQIQQSLHVPQMELAAGAVHGMRGSALIKDSFTYYSMSNVYSVGSSTSSFTRRNEIRSCMWSLKQTHLAYPNHTLIVQSLSHQQIIITGTDYLIQPPLPRPKALKAQAQVPKFLKTIGQDRRFQPLKVRLNIEGWEQSGAHAPKILFNSESTCGYYRYNQGMEKIVNEIIAEIARDNPHLGFNLKYVAQQADHIQQKGLIETVGPSKKDAGTYHLSEKTHQGKTSNLSLVPPSNVQTLKDWLISNGDLTFNYIEQQILAGNLKGTPESYQNLKGAIRECVALDIAVFRDRGVLSMSMQEHGSLQLAKIACDDITRFHRELSFTSLNRLDRPVITKYIKDILNDVKPRVAMIQESSRDQGDTGRMARWHRQNLYDAISYACIAAEDLCPSLHNDPVYKADVKDVFDLFDGNGSYNQQLNSPEKDLLLSKIKDPKANCNLYARSRTTRKK